MAYDQTRTLGELGQNTTVSTGGVVAAVNQPPQFDNSLNFATTNFLQAALGSNSGMLNFGSNTTIGAAQVGQVINIIAGGLTITINTTGLIAGSRFLIVANYTATTSTTITSAASFNSPNVFKQTTITITAGEEVGLIYDGVSSFVIENNLAGLRFSANFLQSGAANGYQKLPSGILMQWGSLAPLTGGNTATATFSIAFSSAVYLVLANPNTAAGQTPASANPGAITTSAVIINGNYSSTLSYGINWLALGK